MEKFDDRSADEFFDEYDRSDDGIPEEEFVEFMRHLPIPPEYFGDKVYVTDPTKMANFMKAVKLTKELCAESGGTPKLTYGPSEGSKLMYAIEIKTDALVVSDNEKFSEIGKLADGFEVYPLTTGNLWITLSFHHMAQMTNLDHR